MERTYSYLLDISSFDLQKKVLEVMANRALKQARLEAPIKTGNLRRSIQFVIQEQYIEIFINPSFYKNGNEYYQFLDDNNTSAKGYWERVRDKFVITFHQEIGFYLQTLNEIEERKKFNAGLLAGLAALAKLNSKKEEK